MAGLRARIRRGYVMATVIAAAFGLMMVSMVSPVVSTTEDFSMFNTGWNGTSGLALSAYQAGKFVPSFRMVTSGTDVTVAQLGLDQLHLDPASDALAVIGPSEAFSESEGAVVGAFVRAGGVLLLADDFGSGNSLLQAMGADSRFSGKLVIDLSFEKKPEFPVCFDLRLDELTGNVSALQLNHASSISLGADARGIAYTSGASWLDVNGNGVMDHGEPRGPFAVVAKEPVGQGMVVLLSDPSVLINGMRALLGNGAFAENLVTYLSSSRSAIYFDESHRAFFDPVAVTTQFTGSISDRWKGAMILVTMLLVLWVATDFVDRGVAWTVRATRRAWSYVAGKVWKGRAEEPAPEPKDLDEVAEELLKAHPEWRQGLVRHLLGERSRHSRAQTRR